MSAVLLPFALVALGSSVASAKDIGRLYDRIAVDVLAGRPLVATLYVALCDNDSQGIVPVKNRRICRGDDPDRNLYWATAGGLAAVLKQAKWQRVSVAYPDDGDLAVKAVWRKTFAPGGALRARGVQTPFEVFIVGRGYRGERIRSAMLDYLDAVNRDGEIMETAADRRLLAGGASHMVGYIGHDYFYDVTDWAPLLAARSGDSVLQKGTLALSCTGHVYIRKAIQRPNAHIFVLNRTLGFPGAWTAEAVLAALVDGKSMKEIHRSAAQAFAAGQGVPLSTALGSFAYGDY